LERSALPWTDETTGGAVAQLNVDEFLERFRERAAAVKERGIPPLEGEARRVFIASAEQDYFDYSLVGSASWAVEEGDLVLRIPIGK
jgi:hypothetical protein